MSTGFVIGIDLGTISTCVAVVRDNNVEILKEKEGCNTFPSVVCFSEKGIKVGTAAKEMSHKYPENTVFEIKRILGCKYSDESTQKEIKNWPFKVINNDNNPAIAVRENDKYYSYYPEALSAMILAKAKKIAEEHLQATVTQAVITVPAYFNNSQRKATKDAAKIAGLKVLRIINEPTAAAIAYGWEHKSTSARNLLVFDLGGGTFDVCLVNVRNNNYVVKATSGDTHFGGTDFDNKLVDFVVEAYKEKHNEDLAQNKEAMRRLRKQCEELKVTLSSQTEALLDVPNIVKGKNVHMKISRNDFERLCSDLFKKTIETVELCISDSGLKKSDVTDVVMVGGSTRIPKLQEMLKQCFDGRNLTSSLVNPDGAVAHGAAIQAAILNGDSAEFPDKINITDVASLSLGINDGVSGKMVVFIKRNTQIPCKVTKICCTSKDNQTAVTYSIYQGERTLARKNKLLGAFTINNIPKRPAEKVKFVCTFSLNENGILHVDAIAEDDDIRGSLEITLIEDRLSYEKMNRLMQDAKEKQELDRKSVELNQTAYELQLFCKNTKAKAQKEAKKIGQENSNKLIRTCDEVLTKMKKTNDLKQLTALLKETKTNCEPFLK